VDADPLAPEVGVEPELVADPGLVGEADPPGLALVGPCALDVPEPEDGAPVPD